jgi:hypothetical protein
VDVALPMGTVLEVSTPRLLRRQSERGDGCTSDGDGDPTADTAILVVRWTMYYWMDGDDRGWCDVGW